MRRRGLTLVEVMVVVFLLVILLGLTLPSTVRVRDTGARTQTINNLKQCALAVHNYHDTYRRIPDAFNLGGIYAAPGQERSLWFHLLPYVEADNVYGSRIAAVQFGSIIPAYTSPSDPFNTDNAGVLNFAANIRVFGYDTLTPAKTNAPGVEIELPEGIIKSNLTLPRMADGTTNVIMMSTRYSNCAGQRTWYAADVFGKSPIEPPFPSPGVGGFMGAGSYSTPPTRDNAPLTAMFQIAPSLNGCVPQAGLFGHAFGVGGLSTALCDASVKNISPTMSPTTFARAISPRDQQPLGDDWGQD
jgi:prepilin-type N-terminal cleavage/methylation domain-containing protein